jgi:hypothetical protein
LVLPSSDKEEKILNALDKGGCRQDQFQKNRVEPECPVLTETIWQLTFSGSHFGESSAEQQYFDITFS